MCAGMRTGPVRRCPCLCKSMTWHDPAPRVIYIVRAWAASLGCPTVANASACARTEMARRLQAILSAYGLRSVFWEEALHYGVAPPAIVAPWFTGA